MCLTRHSLPIIPQSVLSPKTKADSASGKLWLSYWLAFFCSFSHVSLPKSHVEYVVLSILQYIKPPQDCVLGYSLHLSGF